MATSCNPYTFVITKGVDNNFEFTIKQNDSTLPITIDPTDTFNAKLVELGSETVALTKALSIVDANNGKVGFLVTGTEASALTSDKGGKVDRYYIKPTYKLVIECSTVANGDFIAKICEVYVD